MDQETQAKLRAPIPYQWKIQSKSKDKRSGSFVAYIDARDVMDVLDATVGADGWQDEYQAIYDGAGALKGVVCKLSIKSGKDWITKADIGTPSDYESEKGAYSDAFKRAAVKWGIGRFLYSLEILWLPINDYGEPLDERGSKIKDIAKYLEDKKKARESEKTEKEPFPSKNISDPMTARKQVIMALVKRAGMSPETKEGWEAAVKTLTDMELKEENYEKIIDFLGK
jgi:hypothetical protein